MRETVAELHKQLMDLFPRRYRYRHSQKQITVMWDDNRATVTPEPVKPAELALYCRALAFRILNDVELIKDQQAAERT